MAWKKQIIISLIFPIPRQKLHTNRGLIKNSTNSSSKRGPLKIRMARVIKPHGDDALNPFRPLNFTAGDASALAGINKTEQEHRKVRLIFRLFKLQRLPSGDIDRPVLRKMITYFSVHFWTRSNPQRNYGSIREKLLQRPV